VFTLGAATAGSERDGVRIDIAEVVEAVGS